MKDDLFVDCPTAVNITPSGGPFNFKAGDVLTCSSDGYPEPSYQWTDSNEVVRSTNSTVTLERGQFNLTCTATGNITSPCSASNTVAGFAVGMYGQQTKCDRAYLL